MKWSELTVVAAEKSNEGLVISNPLVRMCERTYFLPGDVNEDNPEPNLVIYELEMYEMLEGGSWVQIPDEWEWQAEKGKVTVVMSARLAAFIVKALFVLDEFWRFLSPDEELDREGMYVAYLSVDEAVRWRATTADKLLAWADKHARRWLLATGEDRRILGDAEQPYRHALWFCPRDKERLQHLYASSAVVITESDPRRLPGVTDLAVRDLEVSPDQFREMTECRRKEILASSA
jgi:hypothetical protein